MKKQYHILNGDALRHQFPPIEGEIITCRECLIEGNVEGDDLKTLYANRAHFLSKTYGGTREDYHQKVVSEFDKILKIESEAEINLWFEDDLFCQVNLWFILHLLSSNGYCDHIYLIRPKKHTQYGFGGFNKDGLIGLFKNRIAIKEVNSLAELWNSYRNQDIDSLLSEAAKHKDQYPFIHEAVKAHLARIPTKKFLGRPSETLLQIMSDLNTKEFAPIFREFCKRESIYGFGDSQVRRLFNKLLNV